MYDRDTPVAELGPLGSRERKPFPIQRPTRDWSEVAAEIDAFHKANPNAFAGVDSLAMLREDRGER